MNIDPRTVRDFGREWRRFDQAALSQEELRQGFERYFRIPPWNRLPPAPEGFDLGCGSGRWARLAAERVARLHCVDPSPEALATARANLVDRPNCVFHLAGADTIPLPDSSMDFGYSLGVLHHVPDTIAALRSCVAKLKPGAPLLLYLYYALDNKPLWYRGLWRLTNGTRYLISRLPAPVKFVTADIIAALLYWPLARGARWAPRLGLSATSFPLAVYRHASFYTMRTDALDRFGTRLEKRFTAGEIQAMMLEAGLDDIRFSDAPPFWCSVGFRRADPS